MSNRVAVVGVGWIGYQSISTEYSYKEMMYLAALRAYEDAGIDPRKDIQSFVTVAEDFHEGTSIFDEYVPDQIGAALRPVHTITGDGLHGIATAMMLIKTGMFDIVAVEGHSKASNIINLSRITSYAQDPVLNRPLHLNTLFIPGLEMNRYLFDTGTSRAQCASVVVKNRKNALKNPNAPYGANLSIEQVVNGPELAWPLGAYDIASHSDGAIVMVLASESAAKSLNSKPVWIIGAGWINNTPVLEYRNWSEPVYIKKAAAMAYQQAGISNPAKAIDLFEIDDTYSYKELQALEMLGIFRPGEAGDVTENGYTSLNGQYPVNVSGGSLGNGNLLEANGLFRALEIILQLRGEAGSRQLPNAQVGLAQSWRGIPTNSGSVLILAI